MSENIPNNQENFESENSNKEVPQTSAWDELRDVENDSFNPQPKAEKSLELSSEAAAEFRALEERRVSNDLTEEMRRRDLLLEQSQHEPSAKLEAKIRELGIQIDVDSDFYGEISDPDDARTPSEIYASLSAKYSRIAERGVKTGNKDFANEYNGRAKIAREAIAISEGRQRIFTQGKQAEETKDRKSLGDFRIM